MRLGKTISGSAFAAAIVFLGANSQAARLGHPGVSTTGVKGAPTQWQLLCDPADVTSGSTTTSYSAYDINGGPLASLAEVDPQTGFEVTKIELQVQVPTNGPGVSSPGNSLPTNLFTTQFLQFTPDTNGGPVIINQSAFPTGAHETGIVQVFWQTFNPAPGILQPGALIPTAPSGDENTHLLIFNNLSDNPNAFGTFLDYLDQGAGNGGITPTPDSYTGVDDGGTPFTYSANPNDPNYVPPDQIDTQGATFQVGTPEPSSITLCAVVGAAAMLRRRRA